MIKLIVLSKKSTEIISLHNIFDLKLVVLNLFGVNVLFSFCIVLLGDGGGFRVKWLLDKLGRIGLLSVILDAVLILEIKIDDLDLGSIGGFSI